jgi:hypothetical protein
MGRRQKEFDEAVQAIGSNVTGTQGDIAKLTDLDRLYEAVKAKGKLDTDVIQDEATERQTKSGNPMFGDSFPSKHERNATQLPFYLYLAGFLWKTYSNSQSKLMADSNVGASLTW